MSKSKKKKSNNNSSIVVFTIICFIIIVIVFSLTKKPVIEENIYEKTEKEMVVKAKEYVENYSVNPSKMIYIDNKKLDISLPSNCSLISGVFFDGEEYIPYLSCDEYKSAVVDSNAKESDLISLKGDEVVIIPKGFSFYDPGYISSEMVNVSGEIGTEEGVYSILYQTKDGSHFVIRKVVIVNDDRIKTLYPSIKLIGDSSIYMMQGDGYRDLGCEAFDQNDGNISNKVIIDNGVNINNPGEYLVNYKVTNSIGYTNSITRKVYVISNTSDLVVNYDLTPNNMTNGIVTIKLNINKEYKKIILPNGQEGKTLEYQVNENGKYIFKIIDTYDREIKKEVVVNNINKTVPTGSCEATIFNGKTRVTVKITSSNEIAGYSYIIGNYESGYVSNKSYSISNSEKKTVKVRVKDYVGNESSFTCNVKEIKIQTPMPTPTPKPSSLDDNGIRKLITGGSKLRIPISDALAKRGYTPSDLNKCIKKRVLDAGPGTRYGVAAAAFALLDCTYHMTGGYVLSYNHTSGKVGGDYCNYNSDICGRLGINRRWGTPGGQCSTDECWHGLNCATFVRWSMCNGGMNLCTSGSAGAYSMTSKQFFPEADGVDIIGNRVIYYTGRNLTGYSASYLVRMIKPGDAIVEDTGDGHTFVVVGRDNQGIYTAENGSYMRHLFYSEMLNGKTRYRILFLDRYYANTKNRNTLYKFK